MKAAARRPYWDTEPDPAPWTTDLLPACPEDVDERQRDGAGGQVMVSDPGAVLCADCQRPVAGFADARLRADCRIAHRLCPTQMLAKVGGAG